MNGFDASWLRLREPFDAAARDRDLAAHFAAATARRGTRRIVDLAAGSGASFRALAPLIGGDQDWLLVDHDPSLIAAQAAETTRWAERSGWALHDTVEAVTITSTCGEWCMRSSALDLAQALEAVDFAACDGVTTSAFLDLASGAWLERLSVPLIRHGLPFLAMLTVDGRRGWHPAHRADERIDAAFQSDQTRDKGFGAAIGTAATAYLSERLAAAGYAVCIARSDWRIGAGHREMLLHMVEESVRVAEESEPANAALVADWSAERHAQIRSGLLSLEVGHLDMLAIPPDASAPAVA